MQTTKRFRRAVSNIKRLQTITGSKQEKTENSRRSTLHQTVFMWLFFGLSIHGKFGLHDKVQMSIRVRIHMALQCTCSWNASIRERVSLKLRSCHKSNIEPAICMSIIGLSMKLYVLLSLARHVSYWRYSLLYQTFL